jgi:hypothetical protein
MSDSNVPSRLISGYNLTACADIKADLREHVDTGFDFMVVPLVNHRYDRTFVRSPKRQDPLTR